MDVGRLAVLVRQLQGRRRGPFQTGDIVCAGSGVTTSTVTHNLGNPAAFVLMVFNPLIVTSAAGAKPTVGYDLVTPDSFRLIIYNPNAAAATVQVPYAFEAP